MFVNPFIYIKTRIHCSYIWKTNFPMKLTFHCTWHHKKKISESINFPLQWITIPKSNIHRKIKTSQHILKIRASTLRIQNTFLETVSLSITKTVDIHALYTPYVGMSSAGDWSKYTTHPRWWWWWWRTITTITLHMVNACGHISTRYKNPQKYSCDDIKCPTTPKSHLWFYNGSASTINQVDEQATLISSGVSAYFFILFSVFMMMILLAFVLRYFL